jgi:hypothetical protein
MLQGLRSKRRRSKQQQTELIIQLLNTTTSTATERDSWWNIRVVYNYSSGKLMLQNVDASGTLNVDGVNKSLDLAVPQEL